jgi:magnesium and cobalt transporter
MTPSQAMASVQKTAGVQGVFNLVRQSRHVRFPVRDDAGSFLGVVSFFDMVSECGLASQASLDAFIRPPLLIPESTPMMEIFSRLRLARQDMCLVVDAQSQVIGLITSQDVLEEIVGKL